MPQCCAAFRAYAAAGKLTLAGALAASLPSCAIDRREFADSELAADVPLPAADASREPMGGNGEEPPLPTTFVGVPNTGGAAPAAEANEQMLGALLELSVTELMLGNAVVGQAVPAQLAVRNAGDAAAAPVAIELSGLHAADFSVTQNACSQPLVAGDTCVVSFAFAPSVAGERNAVARLSSGASAGFDLRLFGAGLLPGVLVSAIGGHDFGGQEVGVSGDALSWVVENTGNESIGPLSLSIPDASEFSADAGCAGMLAGGATCTIRVSFTPRGGGPRAQTLELNGGTSRLLLNLVGRGMVRLSLAKSGSGTVHATGDGGGFECGSTCSALFDPGVVTLEARTQNGSDSYFSAWSEPGCGASQTCPVTLDTSRAVDATFSPMSNNLIFVTSESLPADLGSVAAHDAVCNRLATAAGINNAASNGYMAAVSGPSLFLDRLPDAARGWVRLDGLPFADLQSSLLHGAQLAVWNSVRYTERGTAAPDLPVRIGSFPDGTSSPEVSCSNWTGRSDALVGAGSPFGGPAWAASASGLCSDLTPFYCMGVTRGAALVLPPAVVGKRIWVSNTPYVPGSMAPDAKCRSERPAGAADGVAFLSTPSRAAATVIDPGALYVRPDGQRVGTGQDLLALDMRSGPWVLADGTMNAANGPQSVWSGSGDPNRPGTNEETCDGWQSTTGQGEYGGYGYDNYLAWAWGLAYCDAPFHLYCVEP